MFRSLLSVLLLLTSTRKRVLKMSLHRYGRDSVSYTICCTLLLAVVVDVTKVKLDITNLPGITMACGPNEAIYIEDIEIETNGDCRALYSEKTFKDFIKRDCTGKSHCRLNESLRYLVQFICEPNLRPVTEIKLDYHCKLFEFTPQKVLNMRKAHHQIIAANKTVFLAVKSDPKWSSRSCSVTSQAPMTVRLLRVDFGDLRDLPRRPACRCLLDITDATNTTSYTWNSTPTSSVIFTDKCFEINVTMSTGLVWIEINATQNLSISCGRGRAEGTCKGEDGDVVSEEFRDAVIVALGLIAGLSLLTLFCTCAVFVCRVHLRCGLLPKRLTSVLRALAAPIKKDDDVSCTDTTKLFNPESSSPTSETHNPNDSIIDMTNSPVTAKLVSADPSRDSETAPRNPTDFLYVEPPSRYESVRRTSLPLRKVGSAPYFNLKAQSDVKIFGSQFTLNKPQTPEIIHLSPSANPKPLSAAPSSSKGSAPQAPEIAQLSLSTNARLLSSEPNSRKGSPTLSSKMGSPKFLAQLNSLLPLQKMAASAPVFNDDAVEYSNSPTLAPSVYSLVSHNSTDNIPNEHESVYSNDDVEHGAYSHLNPFGNQTKMPQNVYDG